MSPVWSSLLALVDIESRCHQQEPEAEAFHGGILEDLHSVYVRFLSCLVSPWTRSCGFQCCALYREPVEAMEDEPCPPDELVFGGNALWDLRNLDHYLRFDLCLS